MKSSSKNTIRYSLNTGGIGKGKHLNLINLYSTILTIFTDRKIISSQVQGSWKCLLGLIRPSIPGMTGLGRGCGLTVRGGFGYGAGT